MSSRFREYHLLDGLRRHCMPLSITKEAIGLLIAVALSDNKCWVWARLSKWSRRRDYEYSCDKSLSSSSIPPRANHSSTPAYPIFWLVQSIHKDIRSLGDRNGVQWSRRPRRAIYSNLFTGEEVGFQVAADDGSNGQHHLARSSIEIWSTNG